MKLWLLRPIKDGNINPWTGDYDKCHGSVVRAESEAEARTIASDLKHTGDEVRDFGDVWLESAYSSCEELTVEGDAKLIIQDFLSA